MILYEILRPNIIDEPDIWSFETWSDVFIRTQWCNIVSIETSSYVILSHYRESIDFIHSIKQYLRHASNYPLFTCNPTVQGWTYLFKYEETDVKINTQESTHECKNVLASGVGATVATASIQTFRTHCRAGESAFCTTTTTTATATTNLTGIKPIPSHQSQQ